MLALVLLIASALAAAPTLHVQSSTANVRATPGGEVVARLAINTRVQVLEGRGRWTKVGLLGRPAEHTVEGFVATELLGPERQSLGSLQVALDAAEQPAERLQLAERRAALAPHDPEVLEGLAGAAENAGRAGQAATVRGWMDAGRPVWIARCTGRRAELVARVDGAGVHTFPSYGEDAVEVLEEARRAGVQRWYAAWWDEYEDVSVSYELEGDTVFPAPFATPVSNEEDANPWVPGTSQIDDGTRKAILGPCNRPGWLATSPFELQRPEPIDTPEVWTRAARAAEPMEERAVGGRAWRPVPGRDLVEVRLTIPYTWSSCGGAGEEGFADVFRLERGHGEPVAGVRSYEGRVFLARIDHAQWLSFPSPGGKQPRLLGLYDSGGGTAWGTLLVAIWDETRVFEQQVITETGGC